MQTFKNFIKKIPFAVFTYAILRKIPRYLEFLRNYRTFRAMSDLSMRNEFKMKWSDRYPCLNDKTTETGFDRHYIYHPAWAARIIEKTRPNIHVDISSSLAFCSIVSAFAPVKFYDFRPPKLELDNLSCGSADLVNLHFESESILSLSCMHVVEHIGLGRYGDTMNPDGDLDAISELKRVLAFGGNLLFVVPIGNKARICYNAHRIYTYKQVVSYFEDYQLMEFSLIPESPIDGGLVVDPSEALLEKQNYGCGCFWFQKKGGQ